MDEQEQIRIRRQAEHDAAEIERTGTYEVLDRHPRPSRAQAMAAVSEFQDAEFSFAIYTKPDDKAWKVRQRAKANLIAIIEALTEGDES